MEHSQSLQEIERGDYQTTYVDGLADLCLGVWLLAFGALMETPLPWLGAVLGGLLFPIWRRLRLRFAVPRLGFARFGAERKKFLKRRTFFLRLAWLGVALFGVAAILLLRSQVAAGVTTPGWGAVPLGVTVAAILVVLAFVYDFLRLISHALLILFTFLLGHYLDLYPPLYTSLAGGVACLYGALVYARFLHDFPLPKDA